MQMNELQLDGLAPSALWSSLDPEIKMTAARAIYADKEARREADMAIAIALRFREVAVRKLPTETRAKHVVKSLRPDESLASALLLALHLRERRPILAAFLDQQEIPHDNGLIDGEYELDPPDTAKLTGPVAHLFEMFDAGDVELYLLTLVAIDPGSWGGLIELLEKRRSN